MGIHQSAVVSENAQIGENVSVGPFCFVDDNVVIGDGVTLAPRVTVLKYTEIGTGTKIHSNAVIGDLPQDVAFDENNESYTKIGANCLVREGVTIHRGTKPGTSTVIGDNCFLMVNSHCGHNVVLGDSVILVNGALLAGYVTVGDRAFISGNCVVHQFVQIGTCAMLSGLSGISQDVPPFCTTCGLYGNTILGLNVVGMRRAGLKPEQRVQVKQCFKLLYNSGLNVKQAVAEMKKQFNSGPAADFYEFLEKSERGICRLRKNNPGKPEPGGKS